MNQEEASSPSPSSSSSFLLFISIDQNTFCIAPYVANESEAHNLRNLRDAKRVQSGWPYDANSQHEDSVHLSDADLRP